MSRVKEYLLSIINYNNNHSHDNRNQNSKSKNQGEPCKKYFVIML